MQSLAAIPTPNVEIITLELRIGDWRFRVRSYAEVHPRYGHVLDPDTVRKVDTKIAQFLVERGATDPSAFQFLRKFARYKRVELAVLFGIPENIVERWESGDEPIARVYVMLLGQLVLDVISGSTTTIERLKRAAIEIPSEIEIDATK